MIKPYYVKGDTVILPNGYAATVLSLDYDAVNQQWLVSVISTLNDYEEVYEQEELEPVISRDAGRIRN